MKTAGLAQSENRVFSQASKAKKRGNIDSFFVAKYGQVCLKLI